MMLPKFIAWIFIGFYIFFVSMLGCIVHLIGKILHFLRNRYFKILMGITFLGILGSVLIQFFHFSFSEFFSSLVWIVFWAIFGVLFFAGLIFSVGRLYDFYAPKKAEKYCIAHGLTFLRVEKYPNCYGLFFRKEGRQYYASFDFEIDMSLSWRKGTPQERILKMKDVWKKAAKKRKSLKK